LTAESWVLIIKKMRVFISHASEDADLARALAKHLSKMGLEAWSSDADVLPGENWAAKISEALDHSEVMVVLMSPAAVKSKWVREEIQYALGSNRYAGRVIPVLVEPTEDFPWVLRRFQGLEAGDDPERLSQNILDLLQKVPQ